jgi:hypothetical protein
LSTRAKARQNLLVASINTALERGLITLECEPFESATFEFELAGLPVIARVHDIGFDEVSVKTIVNPTKLGRKYTSCTIWHEFRKFGVACASGDLERRTGKYLQTVGSYHGAKDVTPLLSNLTIVPNGFGTKPTKDGYDFHKEYESVFGKCITRVVELPVDNVLHTPINFDSLRAKFEPVGLCPNGFTDDAGKRAASWDRRHDLVQEVERAIEWLKLCEQTEKVDRRQTSYGLKHEAERWCREQEHHPNYISNGALLMAAYTLGLKVYRPTNRPNFPNAFLNISRHRPQANQEAQHE